MTNYKHEVRRPADYNDGTIHGWNGGDCPVHPETRIKFWTDEGGFVSDAGHCRWGKDTTGLDPDIIAFKVIKQHVALKVTWVNEYEDGYHTAHNTEEEAKHSAKRLPLRLTRIAVKYVEAIADARVA